MVVWFEAFFSTPIHQHALAQPLSYPMSEIGHERTPCNVLVMSALPSKSGQTRVRRNCPLRADIVAKVSNRGATIFPPEDKTGSDRRL